MPVPDALLNSLQPGARPGESAIFSVDSAPDAGSSGPLFASVMREMGLQAGDAGQETAVPGSPEGGNALPELPAPSAELVRLQSRPIPDANLEDFAVTMGIDRSLARLLLHSTASDPNIDVVDDADGHPNSTATDAETSDSAAEQAEPASIIPLLLPLPPMTMALAKHVALDPVPVDKGQATAQQLPTVWPDRSTIRIGDEDLLMWRASAARTSQTTATATMSPEIPMSSAGMPLDLTNTLQELRLQPRRSSSAMPEPFDALDGMTVDAEDVRTASGMIPSLGTAAVQLGDFAASMASARNAPSGAVGTTLGELRARAFTVAGPVDAEAEARLPDPDPALAPKGLAADVAGALAGGQDTPAAPAALAGNMSASGGGADAAPRDPSLFSMTDLRLPELLTPTRDPVEHLRLPDHRLGFYERASTFADAVAQRMIGQIRSEKWNVSLQLEPYNLGSMDINLALNGSELMANVNIANHEAKAILEAGLPRLKESLESYGLQLAGWSFGQSGSRARGDSPTMPFIAQAYGSRMSDADAPVTPAAESARKGAGQSPRAVDLFV